MQVSQWVDQVVANGNTPIEEWHMGLDLDVMSPEELFAEGHRMMTHFRDYSFSSPIIKQVMQAAAQKGHVDAQFELGFRANDVDNLRLAVEAGHPLALNLFEIRNRQTMDNDKTELMARGRATKRKREDDEKEEERMVRKAIKTSKDEIKARDRREQYRFQKEIKKAMEESRNEADQVEVVNVLLTMACSV